MESSRIFCLIDSSGINSTKLTMPTKRKALSSDDFRSQCETSKEFVTAKGSFSLDSLPEYLRALEKKDLEHKAEIESLRNTVALLQTQSSLNRNSIASLKDDVTALTQSLETSQIVRHQFISMFKRDKLENSTQEDLDIIVKGDMGSSVGDVLVDVELYKGTHARRDWYSFEKLYGFIPPVAESFTHPEIIDLLNKHATVITSNEKNGSNIFYQSFSNFVDLFKKSNYDEEFLLGKPTAVTTAYLQFLKSCEGGVQECV